MGVIFTGIPNGEPVKERRGWSKSLGHYTEYVYRGTHEQMEGIFSYATSTFGGSDEVELDPQGPAAEVRIRVAAAGDGSEEVPVDDVRMDVHRVEKDILEHPYFDGADEPARKELQDIIDRTEDDTVTPASLQPYADMLPYLGKGQKTFLIYVPVLIRTQTASSKYIFTVGYSNVGSVFLPADIEEEADLEHSLRFNLPTTGPLQTDAFLRYGWLKHCPTYQSASNGRYVLTREYEFGLWNRLIYPDAT